MHAAPAPGARREPVYVHAKIGIVDDRWLTLGSANLNEHSLFNDTEVNIVTCDPELARATRLRLWGEHLERDDVRARGRPDTTSSTSSGARSPPSSCACCEPGDPQTHRLAELPGVSRRVGALRGPLDGLLVDG